MGTINYSTSDYITLGVNPDAIREFNTWYGFEGEILEADENSARIDIELILEDVQNELDKYNLHYYHIATKPGYYEGFSLDIENNYCVALDSWEDRREMNKEITQIKQLLLECARLGLVACYPGWCTGYEDYNGTIKAIKAAIKEMRAEVKATPTWAQYERA